MIGELDDALMLNLRGYFVLNGDVVVSVFVDKEQLLFEELFYCHLLIMYAFLHHFASTNSKLVLVERLMVTVEELLLLVVEDLLV